MRNVTIFLKGNLEQIALDREALTCWMVNNDFPDTVDASGSTGNASDATVNWTLRQQDCAIIVMDRLVSSMIRQFPELASMSQIVYSDDQCRALYDAVYNR